jgi:hypothetical protein
VFVTAGKTAEIIPSSTANHTKKSGTMHKRVDPRVAAVLIQRRRQGARFGPDFIELYQIRRKSDPKRH